ncbi:MAG: FtsX-like permease family protein [Candidatus Bathyarchaeia archaeon]
MALLAITKIATRNIPRRKLRNILTIFGIVLGVALFVSVNIALDSVNVQLEKTLYQATGDIDILVQSAVGLSINDTVLDTVKNVPGVEEAAGRVYAVGQIKLSNGTRYDAQIIGVNSKEDYDYLDPAYTNITGIRSLTSGSLNAVVDERLGFKSGSRLRIEIEDKEYNLNVTGTFHPSPLVGWGGGGYYRIYMDIKKVQEILDVEDKFHVIIVKVTDVGKTDEVIANLRHELGSDYEIASVKQSVLKRMQNAMAGLQSGLKTLSIVSTVVAVIVVLNTVYMNVKERTYEVGVLRSLGVSGFQIFWIFFSEALLLSFFGIIIGIGFGIGIAKVIVTTASAPFSMGLLARIESSSFLINYQHLKMGALSGLMTTLIGGTIPSVLAVKKEVIKALRPNIQSYRKLTSLKLVLIGSVLVGVGSYFEFNPAYQSVIGSIPGLALDLVIIAGLVCLCSGLLRKLGRIAEWLLYPFIGRSSRLVTRNVSRNLVRSTVCFTLIGISLCFVVAMGGMEAGVTQGVINTVTAFLGTDAIVFTNEAVDRTHYSQKLLNIDQGTIIESVAPSMHVRSVIRNIDDSDLNSTVSLNAIDIRVYPRVMNMSFTVDTPSDVYRQLKRTDTLILAKPLAESLGNLTVGDKVEMMIVEKHTLTYYDSELKQNVTITYKTPAWKTFRVIGIVDIQAAPWVNSKTAYISYQTLNKNFPDDEEKADTFYIRVKSDYVNNLEYVKKRLEERLKRDGATVITRADLVEYIESEVHETFLSLNAITDFSLIIAILGMTTIMVMNVSERRREIGIMKAQGTTNTQILKVILGEALLLGLIGYAIGVTSGLVILKGITARGYLEFHVPFIMPYGTIKNVFFITLGICFLSALIPMIRAFKMTIIDAIKLRE